MTDLGGGGGALGLPLYYFEISFLVTFPRIFLKAPSVPIKTNFEGETRNKKRLFFGQNFQKVPEIAFFCLFFKTLPAAQKILPKRWENSENQVDKIILKILKIRPPPLKKILDLPLGLKNSINLFQLKFF